MSATVETSTVVIGASAAGLAVAACLKHQGKAFILLEQSTQVAQRWREHYDRLHLHTSKFFSQLPYTPFPADMPRYPARDQVVQYLETYMRSNDLQPRFGERVLSADLDDGKWITETANARYQSTNLIVATGNTNQPYIPHWPGEKDFRGEILHSSRYKNGEPYRSQPVLVIGLGNSGGEIAVDLVEHGAQPAISVRSPINILSIETLGLPTVAFGIALDKLPPRLADMLTAPMRRLTLGNTSALGLGKPIYGPIEQIKKTGRIPVIDVGTIQMIKHGAISVRPDVERFTEDSVRFKNGATASFAAVILATGYRPNLDSFLKPAVEVTDEHGFPLVSGKMSRLPGLYFCGFHVAATGMLREIGREARQISGMITNMQ